MNASGFDTSPDADLVSPQTLATEEGASFAMMVQRAAQVLDRHLRTVAVKTKVLIKVLQLGFAPSEALLPFNDTHTDILLTEALHKSSCVRNSCQPPSHRSRGLQFAHPALHPGELVGPSLHF